MITAVVCTYQAGDVLPLAVDELARHPAINCVLIIDGPTKGCVHKAAIRVPEPSIKDLVTGRTDGSWAKVRYLWLPEGKEIPNYHRANKVNLALGRGLVPRDTSWILVVDSDEIWSQRALTALADFLTGPNGVGPQYGRYRIRYWNPYPTFDRHFELPQENGRIYQWFPDARCPDSDRLHQYVLSEKQRAVPAEEHHWGCALLPMPDVRPYHLNAMRAVARNHPQKFRRVTDLGDGRVRWKGGGEVVETPCVPLDPMFIPDSIKRLGRDQL